jgi:ribosomal-protein-alanine N-acetyltransferase
MGIASFSPPFGAGPIVGFFSLTMTENYLIRPMQPSDLARVLEIEDLCYPNPWSAELFQRELDNHLAAVDLLWVEGELAGYLCSWLVSGELNILNVAVAPDFRRRGAAAALLRHVVEKSRDQGFERAFLEVRIGNAGAIALYRSFGFKSVSLRKCYYPDGEDALVMVREA